VVKKAASESPSWLRQMADAYGQIPHRRGI